MPFWRRLLGDALMLAGGVYLFYHLWSRHTGWHP